MTDPRRTYKWKRLRKLLVRNATACAICGFPLLQGARARSPLTTTVDHIIPLALGGDPYARSDLRTVHYRCNSARGAGRRRARRRTITPRRSSRLWL
jgi:5-methylcytosine-specific restriction endonuclease McrA